jgi:hypothetical protein
MRQADGGHRVKFFSLFLMAAAAFGAAEGTVQNVTTGKPQANAVVTLVELGSDMNNLGSVRSDASGKFTFDVNLKNDVPYLLQALHQGVTYNQMLPPGSARTGMKVDVYDASAKVPEARVAQHMILLEPSGTELMINESVIFNNTGKVSYSDPDGTLKVWIPQEVNTPVRLRITAPQGMPISREAEKSSQPNVYVVRYPIKPGETRIDLQYSMPAGTPAKFSSKILHGGGPVRIVAPKGVKLVSESLNDLGPEPRTQATVYDLKGTEYAVSIEGTGSLREGAQKAESSAGAAGEDAAPGIEMLKPRLYQRVPWVVGLTLAMLAVGLVMLYRTA